MIQNPCKNHVMGILHQVYPIFQTIRGTLIDSTYSTFLNTLLFTDGIKVYKLKPGKIYKFVEMFSSTNEIIGIYEMNSTLYLFHCDGYTSYRMDDESRFTITFDKQIIAFHKKCENLYMQNMNTLTCFNIYRNTVDNFSYDVNESLIIVPLLNNKLRKVSVSNNKLCVDNSMYNIPESVLGKDIWYNFEIANENAIVLEVCSDFTKNWYILFNIKTKTFSNWIYHKHIIQIISLYIPKTLIVYENMILILSFMDFYSLFQNTGLKQLLFDIDKGNNSMVYYRDKNTVFCLDSDERYIYYIYNKSLMATNTSFPYDMHILCKLKDEIFSMNVHNNEVLLQYKNLDIELIKI